MNLFKIIGIASLSLVLVLSTGCGPLPDPTAEKESQPIQTITDPTPEEIANALNAASAFAYGWFWDNVHVDHKDIIYDDAILDGSWPCERVTAENITSKEDVFNLTKRYFTEETAQNLMAYKEWIELDGALYVSATEGLGGVWGDSMELTIHKDSETQYTITVQEFVNGEVAPWISTPYSVHYQCVDGHWVFDDVVLTYDMPITIRE